MVCATIRQNVDAVTTEKIQSLMLGKPNITIEALVRASDMITGCLYLQMERPII